MFCIYSIINIISIIEIFEIVHKSFRGCRFKNDGVSRKTVPLFGKGFLYVVDNLFWNLPFASVKQSIAVREKFHITEEEWTEKWKYFTSEHDEDGAREQLISGWKSWVQNQQQKGPGEGGAATAKPDLSIVMVDE
jgi:hypothetical protein